ncbi:Hydroxyacid oxidase [Diplodia seriata]|uniref:Hydroxyacid oxidase n=1 Tax=Diplodia seriata TaxID=420778 RepID=A0A1S8B898_9PEZI|nr:Hydroxyacid oxidase [Diplodia seriata]
MRNVTNVDTSTTIFGHRYPLPIGIAPSAMQRLVGGNGEVDMARAASVLGMNMTLSSQSTTGLEEVIRERNGVDSPPPFWMQIYLTQDLAKSTPLIKRAEAAGYEALVVTVDTPVLGNRINERKTPLVLPDNLRLANIQSSANAPKLRKPTFNRLLMDARTAQQAQDIISSAGGSMHSASLEWASTIDFLRKTTNMKIILKGIMTAEDAALAVEHGADAIVVSNHGGRQLDCAPSTIEVLPDVAKAVAGKIPVVVDGGITRGSDVLKAVALGADFVLVGRAVLWGLAVDGQRGVEAIGNILERELSRSMALAGIKNLKEADRKMLAVARTGSFGMARL